ncbi:peptidoglycan-recognition protein SC2-like [Diabrotica undecimpunctata]|uniref:peptidoglycan-recognition protein SC2-like n=1 Tax=Diabrotica undecimpunctata TaxID=50387 RepID=UPI003B63AEC8
MIDSRYLWTVCVVLTLFYQTNCECPKIYTRFEWSARKAVSSKMLMENPPPYVVVHQSEFGSCFSFQNCSKLVRRIQAYHIDHNGLNDVRFNFLIGGDGTIYEGRGYSIHGAHSMAYNTRSLGVCLLGNFKDINPPNVQLKALEDFLSCAAADNRITADYHLIGHRQVEKTECPGERLQTIIEKWTHFESSPPDSSRNKL